MEFSNPFAPVHQEEALADPRIMATDVTAEGRARLPRRPSLRTNFSYPKLCRHGSSESHSSNGSIPGMTDASDSDLSFDDDGGYNTSAGELWDSFWRDNGAASICRQSQEHRPEFIEPRHCEEVPISPTTRCPPSIIGGGASKAASGEHNPKVEELTTPPNTVQAPPSQAQSGPSRRVVTHPAGSKPPVTGLRRRPHPPRTSSLTFEPPAPPQRPLFLRGSRPSASPRPPKSTQNLGSLFIPPTLVTQSNPASPYCTQTSSTTTTSSAAASVPVSPAYPPPPPPQALRPSTSALNIQNKGEAQSSSKRELFSHNVTAPLPPLLPSPMPEPSSSSQPNPSPEQLVSVFDFDSDSEDEDDEDERHSFAKRIARGLHKKSASSEKRNTTTGPTTDRKAATVGHTGLDANIAGGKYRRPRLRSSTGSISRRRGGSLGRIFGLMGR
ncbi:hypothetical protein F4777DRAFT_546921 [Nemania sp. FL0916]|nr:hypothetical protein F4777DRAFT_546921 [Nemania sp. FL0916]